MTSGLSDLSELPPGYYLDRWNDTGAWCSLPWPTKPADRDRLLRESLGPTIIAWAHGELVETFGPGFTDYQTGRPWRYTPGQQRFLILWYAYDPQTGRWRFRRGVKRGAKGTGKDPFGGSMCNVELVGPCHLVQDPDAPNGWTGEAHRMPLVQIAANSESQGKDLLRVANALWSQEARDFYGIDCGETRTYLKSGGRLELLTKSESTAEGDPATFIWLNESHHMTESSGRRKLATVARRNVGKSPAHTQARLCEGTNAHQQGGDSEAEGSYEAWQAQVSGRAKRRDILYDSIEAPPSTNIYDDDSRMAGLRAAYMDASWADLERLSDEMLDPQTPVADSIRYYLNGLAAAEDAWISPTRFDDLARPDVVVADGERVTLFLDCSLSSDATGLVGCRVSDGHVFTLGVWQRPHGERGKGWRVPRHEVDTAVRAAFERYEVVWYGADPSPARDDDETSYWQALLDAHHRDFRNKVKVWATPGVKGSAVVFDMRTGMPGGHERNRLFTEAAEQTQRDIDEDGTLTHDGHAALRMHTHNARRRPNQWGVSLGKVNRDSLHKVDLAVCMVGARMGRRLVLNSGKLRRQQNGKAVFV